MNPEETAAPQPTSQPPIIGYCRATGRALTSDDATYVNGVLYSREYAARALPQSADPTFTNAATATGSAAMPAIANNDVSPGWAFVLGLIPGVGAIYNQQYAKGIFHMLIFGILISLADRSGNATPIFVLMAVGWFFYMAFEAYHTARRRQLGQPVDEMSGLFSLPDGMQKLPIGPLILIGVGIVFLLDNFGLLRIDDLMRFWPVALIIVGVLMLYKRLQEKGPANAE
jgi:hypothetical protein